MRAAALESSSVDGVELIAALVNPDGTLPNIEGCTAQMIELCCPGRPGRIARAVVMVPETLTMRASSMAAFDWLHDSNGIRFLRSAGPWPVEAAAWKSVTEFVKALGEGSTEQNGGPVATTNLIDALGVQMFGVPGSRIPHSESVDARTELVHATALSKRQAGKISSQMPVEWRAKIEASAKPDDEVDLMTRST